MHVAEEDLRQAQNLCLNSVVVPAPSFVVQNVGGKPVGGVILRVRPIARGRTGMIMPFGRCVAGWASGSLVHRAGRCAPAVMLPGNERLGRSFCTICSQVKVRFPKRCGISFHRPRQKSPFISAEPTMQEFREALRKMKVGKCGGARDITVEMIKFANSDLQDTVFLVALDMWNDARLSADG